MNKIKKWIKDGNDCGKCKCLWCDHGCEDYDVGCSVGFPFDERVCRMPYIVRWYRLRRTTYFQNHEYDGCGEFYEESELLDRLCEEAIREELGRRLICNEHNGEYHEVNQSAAIHEIAWRTRSALKDYDFEHRPRGLKAEWNVLLKKTWKNWCFRLKSLIGEA